MYSWKEIGRDRNTEGQTDIRANRKRDARTDGQIHPKDRQAAIKETSRQTDRQTDRPKNRGIERQTDIPINRATDRQAGKQSYRQTGR
jgi:hypothetical protein